MGGEWATWQDFLIEFGAVVAVCVPVIWYALRRSRQSDQRRRKRQNTTDSR